MFIALLLAATQTLSPQPATIEQVRRTPEAFREQLLILCGEVSTDQSILYSDTHHRFHGRVGVYLRNGQLPGRNICVIGRLLRKVRSMPAPNGEILVTDAPVHPDYLFVADPPA